MEEKAKQEQEQLESRLRSEVEQRLKQEQELGKERWVDVSEDDFREQTREEVLNEIGELLEAEKKQHAWTVLEKVHFMSHSLLMFSLICMRYSSSKT